MFCYNCGKQVDNTFKHCPYCGIPLTAAKDSIPQKNTGRPDVEVSLLGKKVFFSQSFIDYNNLRKRFYDKAAELEDNYICYYSDREHTFDALFDEEIPKAVYETVDAVKFGVSVLMEYGIDFIDEETLADMVTSDGNVKNALNYIYSKADEISDTAESLSEYRNAQRASRGHWEGGGFGVKGAVKGALTAGAFNLGTNMFRGIGDAITNSRDRDKIAKMKQELANDEHVFRCLHNAVFDYSVKVFDSVYSLLSERGIIEKISFDSKKAEARAKNHIKQYESKKDDASYDNALNVLIECIEASPYSVGLYLDLYEIYCGDKSEVHELARFFGIERDYKNVLIQADSNWINTVKTWSDKTPSEINKKIKELKEIQSSNPYLDVSEYLRSLENQKLLLEKLNASSEMIAFNRAETDAKLNAEGLESLWELADNFNTYAEDILVSHYFDSCKKYYDYGDFQGLTAEILANVYKKFEQGNELAIFIIAYVNGRMCKAEILKFINVLSSVKKYASPLYYLGFLALKKRGSRGGYWNAEESGLSPSMALGYIKTAADMLFPPAVNYMYELFKYGKYNVTEADPAMAEHYLALLTAINKKESSSELYNRYIKLKENYPKEKAGRCDELLKLESELGRRTDIHDLVLSDYISNCESLKLKDYTIKELYSVTDKLMAFGKKFSYLTAPFLKATLTNYAQHVIKNTPSQGAIKKLIGEIDSVYSKYPELKDDSESLKKSLFSEYIKHSGSLSMQKYTPDELVSIRDELAGLSDAFSVPTDDMIADAVDKYIEYHLKNDLKNTDPESINTCVKNIDLLYEKFPSFKQILGNAKLKIIRKLFEAYNIAIGSGDKDKTEYNIKTLTNLSRSCSLDFSSYIKEESENLTQLTAKAEIDSRTACGTLYDTAEEAEAVKKETEILENILKTESISDAAKQFKLMQCDFKTETVKSKVEELAKKLLGRIFELHNHARRKSSVPRFILSIVGTPIIALFGLAFSIPGILFALAVLYFVWSSFVKSVKKKKLYNIEADKNRAELDEFEKLFIIKSNKLYLRN